MNTRMQEFQAPVVFNFQSFPTRGSAWPSGHGWNTRRLDSTLLPGEQKHQEDKIR